MERNAWSTTSGNIPAMSSRMLSAERPFDLEEIMMPYRLRLGGYCGTGRHLLRQQDIGRRFDRPTERWCCCCHAERQAGYRQGVYVHPRPESASLWREQQPWERQVREEERRYAEEAAADPAAEFVSFAELAGR